MAKNTIIDGIAASEHLDSSGEVLSIEGMDISSLGGPDSILNWEHNSKEKPTQVVGKVTFARKIMKKSDARNKREEYFWNKVKKPFVYIKAELFDGLGHSGAQDVAAMLKYKNKDKGEDSRLVVGFSIEGGKMDKKGMVVTKSIARDVAITVKPCNKVCDAELIEDDIDDDFLYKNQEFDCEILEKGDIYVNLSSYRKYQKAEGSFRNKILSNIKKGEPNMPKLDTPKPPNLPEPKRQFEAGQEPKDALKVGDRITYKKKMRTGKDIYNDPNTWKTENNMRKALVAGMMGGAPEGKTGGAALAQEDLDSTLQKPFHSKAQRRFAHANPEKFGGKKGIKEWEEKTPKNIPEKVKKNINHTNKRIRKNETFQKEKLPHDIIEVHPKKFHKRVDRFREMNDMNRANVHPYSPEDYSQMRTFMTRDGKSGYAIKNGNELVSVHSSERGRGDHLVGHAVKMGAKKLDAYDIGGKLPKLYNKHGFKETGRYSFDPQYADPSNKLLHGHKPDFVEMSIPDIVKKNEKKLKKMGQPTMGFPKMGVENRPEMQVKRVDPEKSFKTRSGEEISQAEIERKKLQQKYVHGQKQQAGAKSLEEFGPEDQKYIEDTKTVYDEDIAPEKQGGVAISDKNFGINEAYDFSGKEKGYPSTLHHEGLHRTFSDLASKSSGKHSKNLVRHLLDNFFHPDDLKSVQGFVGTRYDKDDPHLQEENLTHILDLLTNKDKRNDHEELFQSGAVSDIDYKRLKRGWKDAVKFTKQLDRKGLNKINSLYTKRDKQR